jgi:Protein of unknown function (DUF3828)
MMKRKVSFGAALILVLCLSAALAAAQVPDIRALAVTQNFYDKYLELKIRGLPDKDHAQDISRYFSAEVNALIARDLRKQEVFIKKHPDEKPPWAEGDLFSILFEGATAFKIGKMRVVGGTRQVDVHLRFQDGTNKSKWTDTAVLKRVGRKWVITNILYKGKWQFKSSSSLMNALR